jgi:hypothetical protein
VLRHLILTSSTDTHKISALCFDDPDTAFCRQHGYGEVHYPDGASYIGQFYNGELNGIGQYSCAPTAGKLLMNDGQLVERYKEVKPLKGSKHDISDNNMPFPGRFVYLGRFKKGLLHGHCRVTEPDGFVYDGDWRHGKAHGSGAFPPGDY